MGVGKTIQAIGIMYLYSTDWPLLIICPASLKYSWRDEILKWLPSMKQKDIQLFKQVREPFQKGIKIYILSYEVAARTSDQIERRNFKAVIADEAHYLKSRDAKRSKNLCPILQQARRCILISGTPMLAKPVEMYNMLKVLRPDAFANFTDFGMRYCGPR